MRKKYYVTIEENGIPYNIFVFGYEKSGGYFISDLSLDRGRYHIIKVKLKHKGYGFQKIPAENTEEWVTGHKPKLIRHIDGSTQVSGTGIRSGFFKTITVPKGVATVSPEFNDGGPVFGFVFWGVEKFYKGKNKNVVVFDKQALHINKNLKEEAEKQGLLCDTYVFEGFYLPRQAIRLVNLADGIIRFKHPRFGVIPLKWIPPPLGAAGFFAIGCRKSGRGFIKSSHGFTYGGGVTLPDAQGFVTQIQILYPFDGKKVNNRIKNLDFNSKDRVLSFLDNLFSRVSRQ